VVTSISSSASRSFLKITSLSSACFRTISGIPAFPKALIGAFSSVDAGFSLVYSSLVISSLSSSFGFLVDIDDFLPLLYLGVSATEPSGFAIFSCIALGLLPLVALSSSEL